MSYFELFLYYIFDYNNHANIIDLVRLFLHLKKFIYDFF